MKFTVPLTFLLSFLATDAMAAASDYDTCVGAVVRAHSFEQLQVVRTHARRILQDHPGMGELQAVLCKDEVSTLRAAGVDVRIVDPDLQRSIAQERRRLQPGQGRYAASLDAQAWYEDFKDFPAIEDRLRAHAERYPERMDMRSIGSSLQGRPLHMLRIQGSQSRAGTKPALFVIGTQHAREWLSPMSVMFVVERLLAGYGQNRGITDLLNRVDLYVVPVVNPDGFTYTWAEDGDRMWRKNRRENEDGSVGVDLNRNWPQGFGLDIGSSAQGISNTYRGAAPFSEPETAAVRDAMGSIPNLAGFIDIHAYSQLVLYGPGYYYGGAGALLEERCVATALAQEISQMHGAYYRQLPIPALYPATGVSTDWARSELGLKSLAMEVRPGRHGDGGSFVTTPGQIIPTGEEQLQVVMSTMRWILGEYPAEHTCQEDTFACVQRCHVESACRPEILEYNQLGGLDRVSPQTYDFHGTTFNLCISNCELLAGQSANNGCSEAQQSLNRCIGRQDCDAYLDDACLEQAQTARRACGQADDSGSTGAGTTTGQSGTGGTGSQTPDSSTGTGGSDSDADATGDSDANEHPGSTGGGGSGHPNLPSPLPEILAQCQSRVNADHGTGRGLFLAASVFLGLWRRRARRAQG